MEQSRSPIVNEFLEKIQLISPEKYNIVRTLLEKVKVMHPGVKSKMMYGGIMFSLEEDVGGIFVYKHHVTFEFGMGYRFEDPEQKLMGNGKYRRHLKFKSMEELENSDTDYFIRQMFLMATGKI